MLIRAATFSDSERAAGQRRALSVKSHVTFTRLLGTRQTDSDCLDNGFERPININAMATRSFFRICNS